MKNQNLVGTKLKNIPVYIKFRQAGFDYILNPTTSELHRVEREGLGGSHNLEHADLENFIGLSNLGAIPAHAFEDGTPLPVYDLFTGEELGEYILNKCSHCFS